MKRIERSTTDRDIYVASIRLPEILTRVIRRTNDPEVVGAADEAIEAVRKMQKTLARNFMH